MGLRAQASSVFSSPSTSSQQRLLLPPQNSRRGCGQDAGGDGVQSLNHVWLFANPWTAARQASLSFTISWSLLKLMSIEWMMPSNNLILCCPLLLLPSVFPSIRVFPNESALRIRWPKYWGRVNCIKVPCDAGQRDRGSRSRYASNQTNNWQ